MAQSQSGRRLSPGLIVLIYLLTSALWIGGSDYLTALLFTSPDLFLLVSMLKGWLYITIIAALLYGLLARYHTEQQREIASRRQAEELAYLQARETEALLTLIPDLIVRFDSRGTCLYCKPAQTGVDFIAEYPVGKSLQETLPPRLCTQFLAAIERTLATRQLQHIEYELEAQPDGPLRHWEGRLLYANANEVIAIIRDITHQNRLLQELQHISVHDALTGLFNRSHFEQQLSLFSVIDSLPLTIFVCDVDGLKLVNDTLGHQQGDLLLQRTAQLLRQAFRQNDNISRIGGDEFAVILPHTGEAAAAAIAARIRAALAEYNEQHPALPLGLSVGFAVAATEPFDISRLYREADDHMYKQKHLHQQVSRGNIVNALLGTLAEHDFFNRNHTPQFPLLIDDFSAALNLPPEMTQRLQLLACFHDIGRLLLPDSPDIGARCEAGSRIAFAIPELVPIADLIAKQAEHWDGSGHPRNLSGNSIPLECRIFAIVDAYDSLLNDSAEQTPFTVQRALERLSLQRAIHYDPSLLDQFLLLIRQRL